MPTHSIEMRLVRLAAVCSAVLAYAAPAWAARPPLAPTYPETLTTPRFQLHYTGELTDPANPDRITQQVAGDVAAAAEGAYDQYVTGLGYSAPLDDGDGKIDVWIYDLPDGVLGSAEQDAAGNTSSGWIAIDSEVARTGAQRGETVAHELFHLIQFATWVPLDSWLLEGTAEWAGFRAANGAPSSELVAASVARPDMSLDCVNDACGDRQYEIGGYSRWPFFQYASERYGDGFVKSVFAKGAALADPAKKGVDLVAATLADKGTTIGDVFTDYTRAAVAGAFSLTGLKGLAPATYSTTPTGSTSGVLPVQRVAVNHLAARYLRFSRGGGTGGPCYAATLTLTVALPPGLGSKPAFYSQTLGAAAIPLTISGDTASLSVPWDTCTNALPGYLALPNPSTSADAQRFTVSGSLAVDWTTLATPAPPPPPIYSGPTVAAAAADVAPAIFVYGPQTLRVSATTRLLRLIVFASGPGRLRAELGGTALGTRDLRSGNNDLRFVLPKQALRTTKRAGALASSLRLTSVSTSGVAGQTVSRKLAVVKATRR